jgi:hypothetical protein
MERMMDDELRRELTRISNTSPKMARLAWLLLAHLDQPEEAVNRQDRSIELLERRVETLEELVLDIKGWPAKESVAALAARTRYLKRAVERLDAEVAEMSEFEPWDAEGSRLERFRGERQQTKGDENGSDD